MTKEQIAQYIRSELANDDPEIYLDIDDYKIILKALEQESILEKIRAEIETKYGQCDICEYITDYDGFYHQIGDIADILEIIDKYKGENEG